MQTWLNKNWWVLALNGLIAIIFGVIASWIPAQTIMKYISVFGYIILFSGVIIIIFAFNNLKKNRSMILWLLQGVLNLAVGIIIVFYSTRSLDLFLLFFGIWNFMLGAALAFIAFLLYKPSSGKKLVIINALLCIALGVILLYNPLAEDNSFKIITGIIALLSGVLLVIVSFMVKSATKIELSLQDDEDQDETLTSAENDISQPEDVDL